MIKFKIISSLEELPVVEDKSLPYFIDTETIGLYGKVRLIQIYNICYDCAYIIDLDLITNENFLNDFKTYISNLVCVFYNASYDLEVLGLDATNMNLNRVHDLLLLTKIRKPGLGKYSLDEVCEYFNIDLYNELNKKELQTSDFTAELSIEQYTYAATDVIVLSKLWDIMKTEINNSSYILNIKSMLYALKYSKNGIPVNLIEVRKLHSELCDKRDEYNIKLGTLNVNSPKQCKEALNSDSSNEQTLLKLKADGNELADLIYTQRRILKRITLLESYMHTRVYTRFNVAGAVSGRFTASGKFMDKGINSQQIPRDLKYLFKNSNPEMRVIEADYSTLELRLAAAMYGDKYMRQQLVNGEDLHTSMAQRMTGRQEITKAERTEAKAINFGFVFGMSAKTFVDYAFYNYGVTFTYNEALSIRNTYFTMYKDLASLHKHIWENYSKPNFYVSTALGWRVKPKLGTDAINIPIQGTGAECTKLAIYLLYKKDKTILDKIVNVVHDSIKLEVNVKDVEYYSNLLKECMIQAWHELCKTHAFKFKDIPMEVEVEVL